MVLYIENDAGNLAVIGLILRQPAAASLLVNLRTLRFPPCRSLPSNPWSEISGARQANFPQSLRHGTIAQAKMYDKQIA
jgi:hypothetical protein